MTHVLIITEGPNAEDVDADVNWYLDGTCQRQCAVWYACALDGCAPTPGETCMGEYERHGTMHSLVEGQWMTQSDDCGLAATGSGADSISDLVCSERLGVGVHGIDTDYEGAGDWWADPRGSDTPDKHTYLPSGDPIGGRACAACSTPVDSEPCPHHQPVAYWWSTQR